jgi:hypothetical protein
VKRILFLLPVVCLFGLLAACKPQSLNGTMLSMREQKAVLAFSEAETDNLMDGLNTGDYAVFSKDFNPAMLQAMPYDKFEQWQKQRETRLGWYLRREVEGMVRRSDDTYTVIYHAGFQFNDDVLVRVVFKADPPHQISGLWLDK